MIEIAIAIGALIFWNLVLSFLVLTSIICCKKNDDEIEAIKSWYPFCEILKIKIPEKDDFEWEHSEKKENDNETTNL